MSRIGCLFWGLDASILLNGLIHHLLPRTTYFALLLIASLAVSLYEGAIYFSNTTVMRQLRGDVEDLTLFRG